MRGPLLQGANTMTPTATSQAGLFAQLVPLLAHRAVLITVSKLEGDQLQVNICPRQLKDGENQALTTPLCVTGTAAELDADLVPQIASFVASHAGLNTNLAAIEKEIAEAEKAAREEAKKKHKVVGNGERDPLTLTPSRLLRNRRNQSSHKCSACSINSRPLLPEDRSSQPSHQSHTPNKRRSCRMPA
jgi:PRTRC genetic system protein E